MYSIIYQYINKITLKLKKSRHRLAIAFHVINNRSTQSINYSIEEKQQENDQLIAFISSLPHEKRLIISSALPDALAPEKARVCLGEEYGLVVFDARDGFNVDACGVVSGVLCAAGVLLLILPEREQWSEQKSVFINHVKAMLNEQTGIVYFEELKNRIENSSIVPKLNNNENDTLVEPYKTADQHDAVEGIFEKLKSSNKCCVVLTSGRGRGKSSALGLLTAKLVKEQVTSVLLTAPRLSVADPVFFHLQQQCPEGIAERASFTCKSTTLRFVAPDALLEKLPEADVLFVDEAAAIPVSMLKELLLHYPKIIFSSTTHGYEGTGRGFILKFYNLLHQIRPDWVEIKLHQPVRWSENDPLENWIEKLLFLNVKLDVAPEIPSNMDVCKVNLVNQSNLISAENATRREAIFSLLIFAHYRTSPSDFQYMLDSEDVRIYALEYKKKVLAVILINQEGGFNESLSSAIYRGERRPKGHLLAQTLCFHAGYQTAASLKYSRIMRIAVHPDIQGMGFGSYVLQQVIENEKKFDIDVIGSSFSATYDLLDFWNKAGLSLLRLGFSRDHVSASHSAVMAKPLSVNGVVMVEALATKFSRNLPIWMTGPLSGVADEVKRHVNINLNKNTEILNKMDKQDIESFALYNRNYEACMPAITRLFDSLVDLPEELTEIQKKIIHASMKHKNNWTEIVKEVRCAGKAEATSLLRTSIKQLLKILDF